MLERVLAELEVERGDHHNPVFYGYKTRGADGVYRAVKMHDRVNGKLHPVTIAFPSATAVSHMWLDPSPSELRGTACL